VKTIKKQTIFGFLLLLSLVITTIVASIAPGFAKDVSSNIKYNVNGGVIHLHLPPAGGAIADHPTNLRIIALDFTKDNKFFGYAGHDELVVQIWYAPANAYVTVALITDNANSQATDFFKTVFAGGAEVNNIIIVEEKQLEAWTESKSAHSHNIWSAANDQTLITELNMPTPKLITLPGPLAPLSFTLPATMTLTFREIGDEYQIKKGENVVTLLNPPSYSSGYTVSQYGGEKPAFVETNIPAWLIGGQDEEVGVIHTHWTMLYIPPT